MKMTHSLLLFALPNFFLEKLRTSTVQERSQIGRIHSEEVS
jgi:hypothetical protein